MIEVFLSLLLATILFVGIMAVVIGIGRAVGYFLGPKEDR